jgi:CheY-like chemotaxis protein
VEEHITVRKSSTTFGLMGSAVVGRKVTDFLDMHEIIQHSGESWTARDEKPAGEPTVLVVERSPFARAHLRGSLEMAGYRVVEAAGFQEAVEKLRQQKVAAVAASVDFSELAKYVKGDPKLAHIPLLGLLTEAAQSPAQLDAALFEDVQLMFDRKAMLHSLERLAAAVKESAVKLAEVVP